MSDLTEPVAIIGMAGRFPDASDIGQFWDNLRDGRECIRLSSDDELLAAGVRPEWLADPNYVKATADAPGADQFDAELFGMTPHEARLCDPQFRVFLEASHAAIENAGYDPGKLDSVGVFGSTGRGMPNIRQEGQTGAPPDLLAGVLNFADYVSILVSYKLNLTGPAFTVLSACSSSLLTVQLAVRAVQAGECDMALAGGVELNYPPGHGYWWAPGGPHSRDGHCRPFDAKASGTVFGAGAGVVLLKRLSAAVADGDAVRAVVRSVVANNDGSDKIGFSAPSVSGQSAAIAEAIGLSGCGPRDISYVEAHGTGTRLGDPIEVTALAQAFQALAGEQELDAAYCGLGSVKGNIGHLSHASGVASLIKVALALEHEQLPGVVNLTAPNPDLPLDGSPFYLANCLRPWPREAGRPRRAGVNSLGFGGTNVHAVLEEAPVRAPSQDGDREQIIVWSARTDAAVRAYEAALADHLDRSGGSGLCDAAATLQDGRTAYPVRAALVCRNASDAAAAIREGGRGVVRTPDRAAPRKLAFLFPGQGAQHAQMARQLYRVDRVFRSNVDACLDLMRERGRDLRQRWEAATSDAELEDTSVAQPLLFAVEYALAQMWRAFGVEPDAVIGHSVGELVAATIAGVIELPDAVRLIMARAAAMAASPPGSMLAVSAAEALEPDDQQVVIAAVNGPDQIVYSGPAENIARFADLLTERKIAHQPVRTSHAFHHPAMMPAVTTFAAAFEDVTLAAPTIPLYSAASGGMLSPDEACSPRFWADQLAQPVMFGQSLDELLRTGDWCLLEVGPERVLSSLARTRPDVTSGPHAVLSSLPRRAGAEGDWPSVLSAVAALWAEGRSVEWAKVRQDEPARRLPLPGYQYQCGSYWYQDPETRSRPERERGTTAAAPSPGLAAEAGVSAPGPTTEDAPLGPFSAVTWIERSRPAADGSDEGPLTLAFLPDGAGASLSLVQALQLAGLRIIPVWPGDTYEDNGTEFRVRPAEPGDLDRVFAALAGRADGPPGLVVHAWSAVPWEPVSTQTVERQLDESFSSFISLVQVSGQHGWPGLTVLTSQTADVSGSEDLSPAKATMQALVRTLNREQPRLACRLVDIGPGVPEEDLVAEIRLSGEPGIVALRGSRRWVPAERPAELAQAVGAQPLRRNGVYLIIGGLGGLGLEVAKGLTRTGLSPRLALVGRNVPPDDPADAPGKWVNQQLKEMRMLGADVRTFAADVADARALRRVLDTVTATFGPVNGVLHSAGVPGGGTLQFTAHDEARAVLRPKVQGTLVLGELFADRPPLDFFALFASRSGVDGDAGGGAYAAANAFQDAYALAGNAACGRILSIDWPAWNSVGMLTAGTGHDAAGTAPAAGRRWTTELSIDTCPILDDHRIADRGAALLPGTALMDLALRAFRSEISPEPAIPARLEDIAFLAPLVVAEPCQVQVLLEPDGERWRFTIQSAPQGVRGPGAARWTTHVTGYAADAADRTPDQADLDALRASMTREMPVPSLRGPGRFITLGPRYATVRAVRATPDGRNKLVELSLPEAFAPELDVNLLHPSLLDSATALARDFDEPFHLPYIYSSLLAYQPLPREFLAHIRRRSSPAGLIVADIDLLSPGGDQIAAITGYAMRVIDGSTFALENGSHAAGTAGACGIGHDPATPAEANGNARHGLAPRDGVQLLLKILQAHTPRQVTMLPHRGGRPVLLHDIPAEWVPGPGPAPARGAQPAAAAEAPPPRLAPADSAPAASYARAQPIRAQAGSNDIAKRLGDLWADVLGIPEIGPDHDFFELGGNSLSAVNLMTAVQQEFSVGLEVTVLFESPTLALLAEAIQKGLDSQD
jgi:phthiocerol/phenolphthiocerol synthesis type-I polyketide synthase E